MCVHGRERIGHAQLVVAAAGVLPASVPLSGPDLCFGCITIRREPFVRYFHFRSPSRDRESANAHRSAHLWVFRTTLWTISLTSRDLSSAIRRDSFTAYGRTSASVSRWPRPGPFTHRCPRKVFESGETSAYIFFFKSSSAGFFFFLRTRCYAGPISLDLVINTRSLLPHSSDRDPALSSSPDDAS